MIRLFSILVFKVLGWKVVDLRPPTLRQYIVVVGPHTSNWDFFMGLFTRSIARMGHVRFLAKLEVFKPPFGWFFRITGGIPVDRSQKTDLVDQVLDHFRSDPDMKLAITPEGTRKRVDTWKTGFHRIAVAGNIPVILAMMDYEHRTVTLSDVFPLTGDLETDIERMKDRYRPVQGKHPENGVF